jgi:PDZ domain
MRNAFSFGLLVLTAAAPNHATVAAADLTTGSAFLSDVREVETRMARIGQKLAAANAPLCRDVQPDTGLVLHTLDSYVPAMVATARRYFGFSANLAVAAVLPGSAAERAGFAANDSIVAVNGVAIGAASGGQGTLTSLVASDRQFAGIPPTQPIVFSAVREGRPLTLTLLPKAACRTRFELLVSPKFDASSDGEMVQISSRFFATLDDGELAVLMAHELAHNILKHPQRLAEARIEGGLLAGFGRNVGYFRQTETQADILSVALLINAGYPGESAPRFWRSVGRSVFGAAFTSRSHPSWRDRAATTEEEARKLTANQTRPIIPDILKSRDQPLDGNWQAILVRDRAQ